MYVEDVCAIIIIKIKIVIEVLSNLITWARSS